MLCWRIAAVGVTVLCVALLVWLYGVRITLIWAAAMAAFLLVLVPCPMRKKGTRPDERVAPERHAVAAGEMLQPAPKKSPLSSGATMPSSSAGEAAMRSAPAPMSSSGSCHPQPTPTGVTPASRASRMSPAVSPTYQ